MLIESTLQRIKDYSQINFNGYLNSLGLGNISRFRNSPSVQYNISERIVGIVLSPEDDAIETDQSMIYLKVMIHALLVSDDDIETGTSDTLLYDFADAFFEFYNSRIFDNGESKVVSVSALHQDENNPPEIILVLAVAQDLTC